MYHPFVAVASEGRSGAKFSKTVLVLQLLSNKAQPHTHSKVNTAQENC